LFAASNDDGAKYHMFSPKPATGKFAKLCETLHWVAHPAPFLRQVVTK